MVQLMQLGITLPQLLQNPPLRMMRGLPVQETHWVSLLQFVQWLSSEGHSWHCREVELTPYVLFTQLVQTVELLHFQQRDMKKEQSSQKVAFLRAKVLSLQVRQADELVHVAQLDMMEEQAVHELLSMQNDELRHESQLLVLAVHLEQFCSVFLQQVWLTRLYPELQVWQVLLLVERQVVQLATVQPKT